MKKTVLAIIIVLGLAFITGTNIISAVEGKPEDEEVIFGSGTPEVTDKVLDLFDPLKIGKSPTELQEQFSTPGGIINRVLEFAFPLAGMILFLMLIIGGFQMITGAGEQKAMDAGRQRVTYAILGFLLLFSSYWIVQILGQILNIKIL